MAAASKTIEQVAEILIEEIGLDKAKRIIERLRTQTQGNQSYTATICAPKDCLHNQEYK